MSAPFRPVPDEQMQAFGLAVCKRLGLDPELVGDRIHWKVTGGEPLGTVSFEVYLPSQEILDMFNGAAPITCDTPGADHDGLHPRNDWCFFRTPVEGEQS